MKKTLRSGILIAGLLMVLMLVTSVSAQVPELTITKSVSPGAIYVYDTACEPQETTVTITVTGFGGTLEETLPIDIVFAIDSSGSMDWNDGDDLRLSGAQAIVDQLDDTRDQVGVVGWSNVISANQPLTQDFDAANAVIGGIPHVGTTNGELGLETAIAILDANTRADQSTEVIIFLTDGEFNAGDLTVAGEIADAVAKGYKIYTVGLTVNPDILDDIATATGGQNYFADSADDIAAIYEDILTTIVTNTAPSNVKVVEVTMPNIINEGSFSTTPTQQTATQFTWNNVAQYVGNFDDKLGADETFTVTFTANSDTAGNDLVVDQTTFPTIARVIYLPPGMEDISSNYEVQYIPQAYLDVGICADVDFKPGSCPNAFNRGDKGVLPVAILGTEDFDVTEIDPATVLLEGIAPLRWSIEDVGAPVVCCEDECDECECWEGYPDGYPDLTLKYDSKTVAGLPAVTGATVKGDPVALAISGVLDDNTLLAGGDCLWVVK